MRESPISAMIYPGTKPKQAERHECLRTKQRESLRQTQNIF